MVFGRLAGPGGRNFRPAGASNWMKGRSVKAATAAMQLDEAELIEQCRQGVRPAFDALVLRYQDRIFNTVWRICGNRSEAEDLTQEAFVKALQAIDRFDGRSGFYTWLFRIATNLALSERRRAARRQTYSLDSAGPEDDRGGLPADQRPGAPGAEPEARACADESHALVLAALASLDQEHRAVVVLRDMESFGYEEIAEILEVPIGTVKSRLHRARMALREKLAPILSTT